MKKRLLISTLLTLFIYSIGFSQNAPIDFEAGGYGADWTWATFEAPAGEDNPKFSVVSNPSVDAKNGSAMVAKIEIDYGTSASWGSAGCESKHGSDIGTFTVTASNSLVKLMIYQEDFASPVALKFATPSGGAYPEVVAQNTLSDQWVEVQFDMSEWIGSSLGNPDQFIFFPSYAARSGSHTVYFDNVTFGSVPAKQTPTSAAPTPTQSAANVMSIFSQITGAPNPTSHYTDVANTDFNPNWGSNSGNVVIESYGGDLGLKYPNLDYQGTLIGGSGNSIDVSTMTYFHFDYWTDGGTTLAFVPISVTSAEIKYDVVAERGALLQKQWVSVEVPLSHFTDYDFTLKEMKFEQGGMQTFHFDNLFFTSEASSGIEILDPSAFNVYPNPAKNSWTIESENNTMTSVEVYDFSGKNVLTVAPNSNEIKIDASSLKSGLYLAQIKTDKGVSVVKLLK